MVKKKQRERRRVSKREIERGWANKGNKERMRLMAERSWHSAIHSVLGPRRTYVRSLGYVVSCSLGNRQLLPSFLDRQWICVFLFYFASSNIFVLYFVIAASSKQRYGYSKNKLVLSLLALWRTIEHLTIRT